MKGISALSLTGRHMLKSKARVAIAPMGGKPGAEPREAEAAALAAQSAFFAVLAPVIVRSPAYHPFAGAIAQDTAAAVWRWLARDVAPAEARLLGAAVEAGTPPAEAFETVAEALLARIRAVFAAEEEDRDLARRNTLQLGGEDTRRRLPYAVMALRRRALLDKAVQFGRALGYIQDEAALVTALQTVTLKNPVTRALWMQAMVGTMVNPNRVMGAAVKLAGPDEAAIAHGGFAPLVEAMLAHGQDQLALLMTQPSAFNDYDLACRAIDRFHRLMRALAYNCEFGRRSAWTGIVADLTARFSERLERPLRQITSDVTQALRHPRDSTDRVDPERVLAGLNGLYLLTTIRRSRDSLAVNAVLDQVWSETGQTLEVLVTRALDLYRSNPSEPVARERIDAGIKMAEIRYNADYADILRRARDGAERRVQSAPQAL